ncbi:aminodeoxychorismate/anthranilate synthase component II [Xylanimonas allomyrinae]|uniref:Aminodeoxychorismate/anthranilate synthase component II n=1 Tax=Xylanimonas allomyrinae TaxID=2509459 RepID=A0A4P6EUA3_9MICO|nr:aminodeoxychorismate/anthranilate synthase component II [Xylanimonas allomyrinae]QAY64007.1 aminodeoxychorismate/anthranilate synthase component II [Xylanimonas allomyrinae]
MNTGPRILVVDNYDSFVYTIVGYLDQLGARTVVVRNDAVPACVLAAAEGDRIVGADGVAFDGVLVSPGPGTPHEAGSSEDVIRACARTRTPMLGVCLGHQALAEVFGATVSHAPELMHGKTSQVEHAGVGVVAGLAQPFTATRYHSLAVEPQTVPDELRVTCATASGIVMGLEHRDLPLHGVQFHPESVLTQGGHRLLANWLALCGDAGAVERSAGMAPQVHRG